MEVCVLERMSVIVAVGRCVLDGVSVIVAVGILCFGRCVCNHCGWKFGAINWYRKRKMVNKVCLGTVACSVAFIVVGNVVGNEVGDGMGNMIGNVVGIVVGIAVGINASEYAGLPKA